MYCFKVSCNDIINGHQDFAAAGSFRHLVTYMILRKLVYIMDQVCIEAYTAISIFDRQHFANQNPPLTHHRK